MSSQGTDANHACLMLHGKPIPFELRMLTALPARALIDGRYLIKVKVGQGRVGAVYRATDTETQTDVCLRVLHPALIEDFELVQHIERENSLGKKQVNKHLPKVHRLELTTEIPYLVTDWLEGKNVLAHLESNGGQQKLASALPMITQILEGLQILHRAMIPHLDINPKNIIVGAHVSFVDYGISARLPVDNKEHRLSMMYAPPEQLNGEVCDIRADIYSVGMLLYRILLGKLPFSSKHPEAIRQWHENGSRSFPEFPKKIADIIAKCLDPLPQHRYRNADELLSALQNASFKRGWYVIGAEVIEEISNQCITDHIRCGGKLIAVPDSILLLKRGSVSPSVWTFNGKIVLVADPCAFLFADDKPSVPKDSLVTKLETLIQQPEPLGQLAALPGDTTLSQVRLAKVSMFFGYTTQAESRMDAAQRRALNCVDCLIVAEAFHAVFGDDNQAALSLDRALQLAKTTQDHIQIAGFLRWVFRDPRRARLSLKTAEKYPQNATEHLYLAQAWRALLHDENASKIEVGRAMAKVKDADFLEQANTAVSAGQALGATPAVIRWGVSLEQRAKATTELKTVIVMWEQLGLHDRSKPIAQKRQSQLLQELTRFRSRLVPFEIPLSLPEPPYDEEQVAHYGNLVKQQESLVEQIEELDRGARLYSLEPIKWEKPYNPEIVNKRRAEIDVQQALNHQLEDISGRLYALSWNRKLPTAPYHPDDINQLDTEVADQENLATEFRNLIQQAADLDLQLDMPSFPIRPEQCFEGAQKIQEEEKKRQMLQLKERYKKLGWPAGRKPWEEFDISQLLEQLEQQEALQKKAEQLQAQAHAIDWRIELSGPPWNDVNLDTLESGIRLQERLAEKLKSFVRLAHDIELSIELPEKPWEQQQIDGVIAFVKEQNDLYGRWIQLSEKSQVNLGWQIETIALPTTAEKLQQLQGEVSEQLTLKNRFIANHRGIEPEIQHLFPIPSAPFTEDAVAQHKQDIQNHIEQLAKQRKQRLVMIVTLLLVVVVGIIFILS